MKKLANIVEVENEGLVALLGEVVTLFCMNYFYTGTLEGVNSDCVLLSKPSIVFDTGAYSTPKWATAEALPNSIYVMKSAIEAFGKVK